MESSPAVKSPDGRQKRQPSPFRLKSAEQQIESSSVSNSKRSLASKPGDLNAAEGFGFDCVDSVAATSVESTTDVNSSSANRSPAVEQSLQPTQRRQSVPQDNSSIHSVAATSNTVSSNNAAGLLLMKQPLLTKASPHSRYQPKSLSAMSSASNVSKGSQGSLQEPGHSVGAPPLRVQASLAEREHLLKKLDGQVESANVIRQKNARKVSQRYHLQGTPSIAERMVIFDTPTANKIRMRSTSPVTASSSSSIPTVRLPNQSASVRQSYQNPTPSVLDDKPFSAHKALTITTDDRSFLGVNSETSGSAYDSKPRSSSVRLLKHTSPVPYKRPPDTCNEDGEDTNLLYRRATESSGSNQDPANVAEEFKEAKLNSERSNTLHVTTKDSNKSSSSQDQPSTVARSAQLRRKFFNPMTSQISPLGLSDTLQAKDDPFNSRNSSVSEGSSQSFTGAVVEPAIVPSAPATVQSSATTAFEEVTSLRPFNSPGAPNTIDRKKRGSLNPPSASIGTQGQSSTTSTSLLGSAWGTLMRKKKANHVVVSDLKFSSVKESVPVEKLPQNLSRSSTGDVIGLESRKHSSSDTYPISDTVQEIKVLEYLIRHAELITLKSLPFCRYSIASKVDLNQMIVANSIMEMSAIYGSQSSNKSSSAKPSKPPRSATSLFKTSFHSPTSAHPQLSIPAVFRKVSTIQPDDYIEAWKPPPKPIRTRIGTGASLIHNFRPEDPHNVELRTLDVNVAFSHKSTLTSSSKRNFFQQLKLPKKTKRSSSRVRKPFNIDESASVPPVFGEELNQVQVPILGPRDIEASRLKSTVEVFAGNRTKSCLEPNVIKPYTSSQSSVDTVDGIEGTGGDLGTTSGSMLSQKKSQSADNLRNVSFSLESMKSTEEMVNNAAATMHNSKDASSSLIGPKPTANQQHQLAPPAEIKQRKSVSVSVGRSISCREQKPGTTVEKRELVKLKRTLKRLHRSLDDVSSSHQLNAPHLKVRFPPSSQQGAKSKEKRRASAEKTGMQSRKIMGAGVASLDGGTKGGERLDEDSSVELESLSSAVSASSEQLYPLDERVRDKIYSLFGVARSLDELNCDSANETSSEGVEKVEHFDLDSVDEPDGLTSRTTTHLGKNFRTKAKDGVLVDSALSLNQQENTGGTANPQGRMTVPAWSSNQGRDSKSVVNEEDRIMIVALHVGLKKRLLEGGGHRYNPVVITSYPHKEVIDPVQCPFFVHVPKFCFPDAGGADCPKQQELDETYSFMFTDEKGCQIFGYCRRIWPEEKESQTASPSPIVHTPNSVQSAGKLHDEDLPTVYCIISLHRCFELFDKICSELKRLKKEIHIFTFLQSLYDCSVPTPGDNIHVKYPFYIKHPLMQPGQQTLPIGRSIRDALYEHVNLQCLPLYMDAKALVMVFAALLLERKVWLWSSKLSVLSSCAMALHALLYPFTWEHVFVPMTSMELGVDLASCPTPFLIGSLMPCDSKKRPNTQEYDGVLIVDLDNRGSFVKSVGDESRLLPKRKFVSLRKLMFDRKALQKATTVDTEVTGSLEYISECFIHFFVEVLYQLDNNISVDALSYPKLDREKFIKSRSEDLRPFISAFTDTMLFSQFLQKRNARERSRFNVRLQEYHSERNETARYKKQPRFIRRFGRKKTVVVS